MCKFKNRVHIDQVRGELESKLNLFPLLWFTFNFISMISIMIVLFKSSFEKSLPTESIYTLLNIAVTFAVLFKINSVNEDLAVKYDKLISITLVESKFNDQSDRDSFKFSLLHLLRKDRRLLFTAFNVFQLDKDIILPFVGSLISFSVLFVQLSQIKGSTAVNGTQQSNGTNN